MRKKRRTKINDVWISSSDVDRRYSGASYLIRGQGRAREEFRKMSRAIKNWHKTNRRATFLGLETLGNMYGLEELKECIKRKSQH